MLNYFGVTQRHIATRAVYNYTASRKRNIKGRKPVLGIIKNGSRNKKVPVITNTKYLNNKNWGKTAIGVHTMAVI